MGILSTSVGNYLGSRFAELHEALPLTHLFGWIAGIAFVGAAARASLSRYHRKSGADDRSGTGVLAERGRPRP
jgi:hypothetical protein